MTSAACARAIPILMLHAVAPPALLEPHGWLGRLSTPPDLLEATFDRWRRNGHTTLALDETEEFLQGRRSVPKRSLVLTLDDGYLDNWVGLHPLLRSFGFRATVFVTTDFIDPRPVCRFQSGASTRASQLQWKGYLSWEEMRAMEKDRTIDIQSHAKTHTWYFISDRVVDYYRPANALTRTDSLLRFLWLNEHPDRKPFALEEMNDDAVPWGTPVYDFKPALVARRFFPDPEERQMLTGYVASRGGSEFFSRPDWKETLDEQVMSYRSGRRRLGDRESEEEYLTRIRDELSESRRTISECLSKDVRFLAFPQGAFDDTVERVAEEVGYRLWTMASWRGRGLNVAASGSRRIYRCGSGYNLFGDRRSKWLSTLSQELVLSRYSGDLRGRLATGLAALGEKIARAVLPSGGRAGRA